MTHEDYIEGYLKQKMSKWELKYPKPKEDDIFYNPYGQQVKADSKGIVISGGRKYVNK